MEEYGYTLAHVAATAQFCVRKTNKHRRKKNSRDQEDGWEGSLATKSTTKVDQPWSQVVEQMIDRYKLGMNFNLEALEHASWTAGAKLLLVWCNLFQ